MQICDWCKDTKNKVRKLECRWERIGKYTARFDICKSCWELMNQKVNEVIKNAKKND